MNNTAHILQQRRAWATLRHKQCHILSLYEGSRKRSFDPSRRYCLAPRMWPRENTRDTTRRECITSIMINHFSQATQTHNRNAKKPVSHARNSASIEFSSNNSINSRPASPITCPRHIQHHERVSSALEIKPPALFPPTTSH